jgi:hypothetical protein
MTRAKNGISAPHQHRWSAKRLRHKQPRFVRGRANCPKEKTEVRIVTEVHSIPMYHRRSGVSVRGDDHRVASLLSI